MPITSSSSDSSTGNTDVLTPDQFMKKRGKPDVKSAKSAKPDKLNVLTPDSFMSGRQSTTTPTLAASHPATQPSAAEPVKPNEPSELPGAVRLKALMPYWERYAESAGIPAHLRDVPQMILNIAYPQASTEHPSAGQTIPVIGGAIRAQRELWDQPGTRAKVYGLIPLLGPPGYRMGEQLDKGDFAGALGSMTNIITQLIGMKASVRGNTVPTEYTGPSETVSTTVPSTKEVGAVSEKVMPGGEPAPELGGGEVKTQIPGKTIKGEMRVTPETAQSLKTAQYTPKTTYAPGTNVVGAPRGTIGRYLAGRLGLTPGLTRQVEDSVENMRKKREEGARAYVDATESARKQIEPIQRSAAESEQELSQQAEQAAAKAEEEKTTGIKQVQRETQATEAGIQQSAEKESAAVRAKAQQAQKSVDAQTDAAIQHLQSTIDQSNANKLTVGRSLLADTAKALYEEDERVSLPFRKLGEELKGRPVSTVGDIREIIVNATKEAGAHEKEIPNSVYKALPPDPAGVKEVTNAAGVTEKIGEPKEMMDSTTGAKSMTPVEFNDLTRVREDLWSAAVNTSDTAMKKALYAAHDEITNLQEKFAQSVGKGKEYADMKRNYMLFRRGIGSETILKWLAHRDQADEVLIDNFGGKGRIDQLVKSGDAAALRDILHSVGINVSGLDDIIERESKAKEDITAVTKEGKEAGKQIASGADEKVAAIQADADGRIKVLRAAADDQIKAIEKTAKDKLAAAQDPALVKSVREAAQRNIDAINKRWDEHVKGVEKTIGEQVKELQETGRQIVPGTEAEDLLGKNNEQLNRMRLRALVEQMRGSGITNPAGLIQIAFGTIQLMGGVMYGLMHVGYGVTRNLPAAFANPRFQEWVLDQAGVIPGSPAENGIRGWLQDIAKHPMASAKAAVKTTGKGMEKAAPAAAAQAVQTGKERKETEDKNLGDLQARVKEALGDTGADDSEGGAGRGEGNTGGDLQSRVKAALGEGGKSGENTLAKTSTPGENTAPNKSASTTTSSTPPAASNVDKRIATRQDIRDYAREHNISESEAEKAAIADGYTVQ